MYRFCSFIFVKLCFKAQNMVFLGLCYMCIKKKNECSAFVVWNFLQMSISSNRLIIFYRSTMSWWFSLCSINYWEKSTTVFNCNCRYVSFVSVQSVFASLFWSSVDRCIYIYISYALLINGRFGIMKLGSLSLMIFFLWVYFIWY